MTPGAADKIRAMSEAGSRALMNANVVTPVSGPATEIRRARALLIRDGTIAAVGSEDEVRERASAGTEFVDMQGRTIVPGFVDAHIHPIFCGLSLEGACQWYEDVARMMVQHA